MRSALTPIVTDLKTDRSTRSCSFTINLDDVDITAKLNELAETNKYIKGWSVLEQTVATPPAGDAEAADSASSDSTLDFPATPSTEEASETVGPTDNSGESDENNP